MSVCVHPPLDAPTGMDLTLTPAALAKLRELMEGITEYRAVASVGWVKGGVRTRIESGGRESSSPVESHWSVGFYNPASLPTESIVSISGIPFVLDESFHGKILDFKNGRFQLL